MPRAVSEVLTEGLVVAISPFLPESAVLREALEPELYEAVLAVRRAEGELFVMFTDADIIEAVRWRC
jgi:glutamine synthetase